MIRLVAAICPRKSRLLYRCCDHVGGQRKIGRLKLETLRIGLRLERFHLSPRAAEYIERVGHGDLGRVKAVDVAVRCAGGWSRTPAIFWRVGLKLASTLGKNAPCWA